MEHCTLQNWALDLFSLILKEASCKGSQSKDGLAGIAYGLILDHKTLAQVAHAREVEMGIGSLRFKLIKDNLHAMLDLLNQATLK